MNPSEEPSFDSYSQWVMKNRIREVACGVPFDELFAVAEDQDTVAGGVAGANGDETKGDKRTQLNLRDYTRVFRGDRSEFIVPGPVNQRFLEVFGKFDHPSRARLSLGPSVALQLPVDDDTAESAADTQPDEARVGGMLLPLSDFLLHSDQAPRVAAVEELKLLHRLGVLSPSTAAQITPLFQEIAAAEHDRAMPAALSILDTLDNDPLYTLGSVQQLRRSRDRSELPAVLRQLLFPSRGMVLNAVSVVHLAVAEADELDEQFAAWLENENLAVVLLQYQARLGFVPLAQPYDLDTLCRRWGDAHGFAADGTDDVGHSILRTLLQIHAQSHRDSWQDHVLSIALREPAWVPREFRDELFAAIAERISVSTDDDGKEIHSNPDIRAALSTHFLYWIESVAPLLRFELTAVLACWFAEQLLNLIEAKIVTLEQIANELGDRWPLDDMLLWSLTRSQDEPSTLRAELLAQPDLFTTGLLKTVFKTADSLPDDEGGRLISALATLRLSGRFCRGAMARDESQLERWEFFLPDVGLLKERLTAVAAESDDEIEELDARDRLIVSRESIEVIESFHDLLRWMIERRVDPDPRISLMALAHARRNDLEVEKDALRRLLVVSSGDESLLESVASVHGRAIFDVVVIGLIRLQQSEPEVACDLAVHFAHRLAAAADEIGTNRNEHAEQQGADFRLYSLDVALAFSLRSVVDRLTRPQSASVDDPVASNLKRMKDAARRTGCEARSHLRSLASLTFD